MSQVKTVFSASCLFLLGAACSQATPSLDLHLGHFETQIDYELSPGNPDAGWSFSISYDTANDFSTAEGIVRLDPASTRIVATPETERVLSAPFVGLGDAGDTIWLLPQANRPGQIFFGWRNVIPPGVFQLSSGGTFFPNSLGSIVVELVDVSGPAVDAGGHFAMWESQSLGGVEMHFNSADGLDANDRLETVPIGGHTHYNYGLSAPGNYEVTFRATGRLNPWQPDGNQDTSATGTFHYSVPFSSLARGEAELRLSNSGSPAPAAIHPIGEPVEYAPGQVMLLTAPVEVGGVLRPYAFGIVPDGSSSRVESHRVGISGTEPVAFTDIVVLGMSPIEILAQLGPGSLETISDGQDRFYFVFSEPGIYRVQVRAVGDDAGALVYGPAFELVFLAGLEADYDFAAYADSFERTHGLAPGSLKEDGSDWDEDGVPDAVEYQLFWEGMDPAVADGHKLPLPDPGDSEQLIVFYRDTYKDRLNRDLQNIVLEYSPDLLSWTGWSDRNRGWPLEQYETGAERGNAFGRIQRRTLRLPDGAPANAYFRWRIDPER
jgi:surface-anchored protein